jgi:sodium-dependent dicarboxylate transporter 2/3/5
LALLPIVKILCTTFEDSIPERYREIETLLPLTLIYGANIGGMGSITGTPANGVMLVYATLYELPGSEHLTFENWLLWGIPMVVVFVLASWLLLILYFRLWTYNNDLVHVTVHESDAFHPLQRAAVTITILFFLLSILFSILIKISEQQVFILSITGFSSLVLILLLFVIPIRSSWDDIPRRMLHLRDCYSNLPWRGIFVVGIILLLLGLGALLNVQKYILLLFQMVFQQEYPLSVLYLVVAALTAFSTELFSNTVVQIAMFIVMSPLFEASSLITIQAFLIITLSCTSAFMTPIATGVNGLAFGEMKGISFARMLIAGLMMKLFSILILAFGVPLLFKLVL